MSGRIYFSPCGIGLGHAGRCLDVAKRLKAEGLDIIFSTYSDALPFIEHEGFDLKVAPSFGYWTWPDGTVDPWRTLKWMSGKLIGRLAQQIKFEVKQITAFGPDLVFSDSRISTIIAAKLTGKAVITMLNQFHFIAPGFVHYRILPTLSDIFSFTLSPVWGASDKVLVPDNPPPHTISISNLRMAKPLKEKLKYVGPILPVRPDELPSIDKLREKMGLDRRPLIYGAVSGPEHERKWLGDKLLRFLSDLPEEYQAVLSLGIKGNESKPLRKGNLTVYRWIPNRFELLKACDLVIGRGSHNTMMHALAYGKPMLLIPAQEQTEQISNARTAVAMGVAETVNQRKMSRELLLSKVRGIFSSEGYRERAEEFRKVASRYDALKTIVNIVEGYTNRRS